MKHIELQFTDYFITGVADLTLWGGDSSCISMRSFHVKKLKEIRQGINDNRFGCESINGAICNIFRNYEGAHRFVRTVTIDKVSQNTADYYLAA